MRLIFEQSAENLAITHPFKFTTAIPRLVNKPNDGDDAQSAREQCIEEIRRKLLILEISDCIYDIGKPEELGEESCRLDFYFTNEFHLLQFQAIICRNYQKPYTRDIKAENAKASAYQSERLSHFLQLHGIQHTLSRKDDRTLTIVTNQLHDNLIVAMQLLKGRFNPPLGSCDHDTASIPLSRSNNGP